MKIPESIKLSSLIRKPEYGSKINWVLSPVMRISVSVGVLGAVGLVVLCIKGRRYIAFSSSNEDVVVYPRSWVVPGLQNLGNNCFLNVVLQALSSCSSFRKFIRETADEFGSLSLEEGDENISLVNALTSLVEELCTVRHQRIVLSPRRLMVMMEHYIPNFNLTRQQDAEEAFSHLLSSLREEISEHYVTNKISLSDLPALQNGRIFLATSCVEESEWQRWSRCFLKPFDGFLGSILVCQSCSFQISLDFQLFQTLHLSPPISNGATIIPGCTLEDCLKRFFVAEHVENYCCSNCWHTAAIEYSCVFAKNKADIEKLQNCNKNDYCECKNLSFLEAFPWSNRFSRTLKQLSISRSPKILCIHLQRASYNMFGQSIKLQGHISFPSILDMSLFVNARVGIENIGSDLQFGALNPNCRDIRSFPFAKYQNVLVDLPKPSLKVTTAKSASSETETARKHERNPTTVEKCAYANRDVVLHSTPYRRQMYRLVSVVVHFGTSGGGHYTVYRKVTAKLGNDDHVALLESSIEQWFCISDSEVYSVSEKDVLDTNASMLFYEKIDNS